MAAEHNSATRIPAIPAYSHQPPRRPQSPSVVQQPSPVAQPSPSTVEASPIQTPGSYIGNGNASYGLGTVEQPRMRASVACDRCRKSKTKCENTGINSVCKSCSNARQPQTCVYTQNTPTTTGAAGRRESTADGEGPPKKRRKNIAPTTSITTTFKDAPGLVEDPLDSPVLTPEVWQELFDIYEKHLAFDFPFFHRRTFLSSVQHHSVGSSNIRTTAASSGSQAYYPPLLLAFLTWTARHHPKLVEQHNNDPLVTAEFYAEATTKSMGSDYLSDFTLEKVQTLLLLGYHEWTGHEGEKGFMRIGNAIRAAQLLKLNFISDHADEDRSNKNSADFGLSDKEQFISQEKQRRTFWSCCLMDRYLSLGLGRPCIINRQDTRVQLVCSDNAFRAGRKVRTRLLGESNEAYEYRRYNSQNRPGSPDHDPKQIDQRFYPNIKWEIGESEHDFVWYMPIVDLFVEITKWSLNTGRRQEGTVPPWDGRNRFKRFDDTLQELKRNLPQHLQLTPGNTEDRAWGNPEQYVQIHAMYTLCTIFLYREYLPFAPWGHARPDGPIDRPKIEVPPPQPNYWIDQAKAFCKACRDFSDLLETVQIGQSTKVIATPMVAFAAYAVGNSMIYCQFFPNYDPDRLVSMPKSHNTVVRYLATAVKRFKIPYSWLKDMAGWRDYYSEKRVAYKQIDGTVGDSPCSSSSDGSRTAGIKDYVDLFETNHKQFGTTDKNLPFHPEDIKKFLTAIGYHEKDSDGAETSRSASIKHEKRDENEGLGGHNSFMAQSGFTSVNSPVKLDQTQMENRRLLVDTRSPSQEHPYVVSPHYNSSLPYPNSSSVASMPKTPTYQQASPDIHLDRNYAHKTIGYDPNLGVQNKRIEVRQGGLLPLTEAEKAAKRAEMEMEGATDLARMMMPTADAPSFGPLMYDGNDFIYRWDPL